MEPPSTPAGARPSEPDHQVDATLSPVFANVFALLVCGVGFMAFMLPYQLLWEGPKFAGITLFFWLSVPAGLVIHEGLHGLGFYLGGARRQDVRYGIAWSKFMPYAHCKVPLTARAYRLSVVLPGLVLGLVPALVGLLLGWGTWVVFGWVMIACAGGDAAILWAIRHVPAESRVLDHPTDVGCRVFVNSVPEQP
jgi:Putative zincin peptidase